MSIFSRFQLFTVLIFLFSCSSQKSVGVESAINNFTKTGENKIVYLFFEIEKTANGTEQVKHTDTKITEGTLKTGSLRNKEHLPGNIQVTFLGKDGKSVSEQIIEDPLNPMMETYAQEGMNKEKINLPKAEFSIRFNQTGNISSVQLEKITEKSTSHLITLKL